MEQVMLEGVEQLAGLMRRSARTVVLSGAGMSTESGVPDFRSNGGMWKNKRFEELANLESFYVNFPEYVAFYRWRIEGVMKGQPHEGHQVLARWQERGWLRGVITQNVDGYHQLAGSRNVQELHGSIRLVRCQACGDVRPAVDYLDNEGVHCACLGNYRPGVVMFGESLPTDALQQSALMADQADLLIVLGSSLQVHPAASLPERTLRAGGRVAIINQGATPYDAKASVAIAAPIRQTLLAVETALKEAPGED